jgi:hypothetical protein
MEKTYGKKKGEEVFYASERKGTISDVTGPEPHSSSRPGGKYNNR